MQPAESSEATSHLATAPIALFVHSRLSHTRQTIEALQKNYLAAISDLYVFADAPSSEATAAKVEEVRLYIRRIEGFKSVTVIERERNLGVDASVIHGVSMLCDLRGRVIVLEDDLVTSPWFLKYMNEGLVHYRDNEQVMQISGFMFPLRTKNAHAASFLRCTTSWGWATWSRAWTKFDSTASGYLNISSSDAARLSFDINGSYDHFGLLTEFVEGRTCAWDICWYLSVFQLDGLVLHPNKSLVENIGFDGSGVHSVATDEISGELTTAEVTFFPEPRIDLVLQRKLEIYLRGRSERARRPRRFRLVLAIRARLSALKSRTASVRWFQLNQRARLMFGKRLIGRDTFIDRTVQVLGWDYTIIGHSSALSEGTWINVNHRICGHKHVIIGNNCYIGRRNFFSPGWQIVISDYCMTGLDCKFMSSDHIFSDPLKPYISSGVTNEKVIRLGVNVWLGAGVSVIGNVSVGHGSVIGAGSVVNRDIPPFSVAIGTPCRVLRRFDFVLGEWVDISSYQNGHEYAIPDEEDYLEILTSLLPRVPMPLQAAGRSFGDMI